MSRLLTFFVCLVNIVFYNANAEGFYSVVAPGTIRPNSNYHVLCQVHKSDAPCSMKISIDGPEFSVSKTVDVQPYSQESVNFEIPQIPQGEYNLTAEGLSGITFKNVSSLEYNKFDHMVFFQTDKATYKPGDLVRFRILILDEDTKPYKLQGPVTISITDPQQNRIKQINNAEFTKGVYTGKLQLSPFPNLGQWEIAAQIGDSTETSHFEVDKYVLPKFEVTIDTAKDVAKKDEKIKAIVRAKYTYGKPVKGEATLQVKPKYSYWREEPVQVTKSAVLDGKASFEIDIQSDLKFDKDWDTSYELFATVKETLTGFEQNGTADVTVHNKRYQIQVVSIPSNYVENAPFDVTVVVKNYDGSPVQDTKNPIKITLSQENWWGRPYPIPVPLEIKNEDKKDGDKATEEKKEEEKKPDPVVIEKILDENGMATVQFTIPPSDKGHYTLNAKYLDTELSLGSITKQESKTGSFFKLESQTDKPTLDKDVSMKVSSNIPLKYFFYQITGRGDIVDSGKIEVPDDRTDHVFKFKPTFDMVPSANVLVFYIKDGEVVFDEKRIDFEQQLDNYVKISAPAQAKAGEDVDITISSKPDSYVGLLAVDQSVLLLKSGNDLNKDDIFNTLHRFDTRTPWGGYEWGTKVPGRESGLVTLTNAAFPKVEDMLFLFEQNSDGLIVPLIAEAEIFTVAGGFGNADNDKKFSSNNIITLRKLFPEVWMWSQADSNRDGEVQIHQKAPDTITSWVLTAFSVNPLSGLGLTNQPKKIQVFQPFFVSTNLPYSVKRGEVIAIPVVVFNYMDQDVQANVTMENPHQEFEFIDPPGATQKSGDDLQRSKLLNIEKNNGVSKSFLIRPKRVGQISMKISAISPVAGDIVQQVLRVDPEGVTEYVNKAVLLDLKDKNEVSQELTIDVPEDHVPESVYSEISVVGDLLGPTIKNLDKLVRKPYGCGEQNMVNFVPNILVLKYLTSTNKLTPTIANKAKKHLEIGYQRELTYKHDDGSYSAFGKSDKSGSTWLTAYVARSFYQAKDFTEIDNKVIKEALEFLAKLQAENGSFPETGKIIDHHHVDKSGKGISLTAFTLLAFLENKEEIPNYRDVISKGLDYLAKNVDDQTDIYSLAIAAYTLQKAKHDQKDNFLAKLNDRATKESDRQWWAEKPETETEKKEKDNWWYQPNGEIEITAYSLLTLLESGAGEETLPILKWLISKRNSNGGFASTQDTVVGLQALIKFAEKFSAEKGDVEIGFNDDKGTNGKITVNDDNALVLQTHVLDPDAKKVTVNGKGTGSTLVQVSYRYNVAKNDETPSFIVKPQVKDSSNSERLDLSVCTSFVPQVDDKVSNMAVMEVSLPSGFVADPDNLAEIEKTDRVKKVETKNGESVVVIYFDDLDTTEICPLVKAFRAHRVAEQKPTPVVVYDYYDNSRQARNFYEIHNTSINEICDGTEC